MNGSLFTFQEISSFKTNGILKTSFLLERSGEKHTVKRPCHLSWDETLRELGMPLSTCAPFKSLPSSPASWHTRWLSERGKSSIWWQFSSTYQKKCSRDRVELCCFNWENCWFLEQENPNPIVPSLSNHKLLKAHLMAATVVSSHSLPRYFNPSVLPTHGGERGVQTGDLLVPEKWGSKAAHGVICHLSNILSKNGGCI